jgi:MFS family permease
MELVSPDQMADRVGIVSPSRLRLVFASAFGALLEWYDFYIYAALAGNLSVLFFPHGSSTIAFLSSLATFGVGFLVRPIGALVFGRLGDTIGRKYTFLTTIVLMGIATIGVGVLPSYAQIGVAAPILLVLLRLLQGFALGGEVGGAATYLAEHAPPKRRGLYTSSLQTTATLGLLLAIAVVAMIRMSLSAEAFQQWGWRVPFLISGFLLIVSLRLRLKLAESPTFQKLESEGHLSVAPIARSLGRWENLKLILIMLFSSASGIGVIFGTGHFFSMFFLQYTLKLPANLVSPYFAIALVCAFPFYFIVGGLSDRIGRKWIMMVGCLLFSVSVLPIFGGLTHFGNTALEHFRWTTPVVVQASQCHGWINLGAQSECDRVRSFLTTTGVVYHVEPSSSAVVLVTVGPVNVPGHDIPAITRALQQAGWSDHADPARINAAGVVVLMWILVLFLTMIYGPAAAFMVELFPADVRYTSLSLPFHIGAGWFGGMLPLVVAALGAASGDIYFGLWYPVGVSAVSFIIGALAMPETLRMDINRYTPTSTRRL